MASPFLSIVIPAHNEERRLPLALKKIFAFLRVQNYTYEVLVVENGSSDRTYEIAVELSNQYKELKVLREEQSGKGMAVCRGMLKARGAYRFMCDADLSMPIEGLKEFIPPNNEELDIAIASREASGAVRYNEPEYRHLGGRLINFAIRLLILPGFQDTQCGFKCFRAEVAEEVFPYQTISGWSFDIEILYIALKKKYRVTEVQIGRAHV